MGTLELLGKIILVLVVSGFTSVALYQIFKTLKK